jgi:uncharacterized protein
MQSSRRKFLATAVLGVGGILCVDATCVEPKALIVRNIKLSNGVKPLRLVHFSDVHFKGDRSYLESVVNRINLLQPDFACFTGDIVERANFLQVALEILSGIQVPLFGVPGNHDFLSGISFEPVRKCFTATGGAWLMNTAHEIPGLAVNIIGGICRFPKLPPPPSRPGLKNIFLTHYPANVKQLNSRQFDLILAGHSHGGQVRLPLVGPVFLPGNVDQYDQGLFQTQAGPLYVNPGIGYIGNFDVRFNCHPEITVIEI